MSIFIGGAVGAAVGTAVIGAGVSTVVGGMMNGGSGGSGSGQTQQSNAYLGKQAELAQAQWDKYQQLYGPMEQEYVEEAKNLGSQANQNKAAQQAEGDVAAQFAGAREQLANTPGVDPSSRSYIEAANRTNLAEAATTAGAETNARQNVVQMGRAAVTDALSLGKGLPAQAMTGLNAAATGLRAAGQFATTRGDGISSAIGKAAAGLTNTKAFQNWMNGETTMAGDATGPGSELTSNGALQGFDQYETAQPYFEYSGTGV